jgi:hypothetical protein
LAIRGFPTWVTGEDVRRALRSSQLAWSVHRTVGVSAGPVPPPTRSDQHESAGQRTCWAAVDRPESPLVRDLSSERG